MLCGVFFFISGGFSQPNSGDDLDRLRISIGGEPQIDYPIFRTPPETEFSCKSRATGGLQLLFHFITVFYFMYE